MSATNIDTAGVDTRISDRNTDEQDESSELQKAFGGADLGLSIPQCLTSEQGTPGQRGDVKARNGDDSRRFSSGSHKTVPRLPCKRLSLRAKYRRMRDASGR